MDKAEILHDPVVTMQSDQYTCNIYFHGMQELCFITEIYLNRTQVRVILVLEFVFIGCIC